MTTLQMPLDLGRNDLWNLAQNDCHTSAEMIYLSPTNHKFLSITTRETASAVSVTKTNTKGLNILQQNHVRKVAKFDQNFGRELSGLVSACTFQKF